MEQSLNKLKDFWFIIIFIGGAIVSWTTFSNSLSNLENRVEKVEEIQESQNTIFTQIQVDIASIKTALEILTGK
tara:strand:+ start:246 stop:467 length:222 start_codon:yes stop_codon:yes gene_type:complete